MKTADSLQFKPYLIQLDFMEGQCLYVEGRVHDIQKAVFDSVKFGEPTFELEILLGKHEELREKFENVVFHFLQVKQATDNPRHQTGNGFFDKIINHDYVTSCFNNLQTARWRLTVDLVLAEELYDHITESNDETPKWVSRKEIDPLIAKVQNSCALIERIRRAATLKFGKKYSTSITIERRGSWWHINFPYRTVDGGMLMLEDNGTSMRKTDLLQTVLAWERAVDEQVRVATSFKGAE